MPADDQDKPSKRTLAEDTHDPLDEEEETAKPHSETTAQSKEATFDDLIEEEKEEEVETVPRQAVEDEYNQEDKENWQIKNLKSQQMPSSGIYSSYNKPSPSGFAGGNRNNYSNFQSNPPSGRSNKLQLFILVLLGLAVIGGTVYLLKSQFKNSSDQASVSSPVNSPSPLPSPTAASIDRSKFKIRILNGTPKAGLAASVSAKLKDLGYQIDKTGNASNSAFTKTVLRTKTSATGLGDRLVKDLAPDYDASPAGSLPDSDAADGEVTLGLK